MHKRCSKCGEVKPVENFNKNSSHRDGLRSECSQCNRNWSRAWREENREDYTRRMKKWREENREHNIQRLKKWRQKNPDKVASYRAKREAALVRATPAWLTPAQLQQIRDMYANCPPGFCVDHKYPILGKEICGLNVPSNLQYLTKEENLKKNNKFVPYIEIFVAKEGPKNESDN